MATPSVCPTYKGAANNVLEKKDETFYAPRHQPVSSLSQKPEDSGMGDDDHTESDVSSDGEVSGVELHAPFGETFATDNRKVFGSTCTADERLSGTGTSGCTTCIKHNMKKACSATTEGDLNKLELAFERWRIR